MRAANYNAYLFQLFGDFIARTQKFFTIPKTGYDPIALFGSTCGMTVLFGNGECAPR